MKPALDDPQGNRSRVNDVIKVISLPPDPLDSCVVWRCPLLLSQGGCTICRDPEQACQSTPVTSGGVSERLHFPTITGSQFPCQLGVLKHGARVDLGRAASQCQQLVFISLVGLPAGCTTNTFLFSLKVQPLGGWGGDSPRPQKCPSVSLTIDRKSVV